MPPIYFQKPEAALKRAEELIKVDKAADALDTLHDTIKVGVCFIYNAYRIRFSPDASSNGPKFIRILCSNI